MSLNVSWCVTCGHNNRMHQEWPPKPCGFPACGCKRWKPEPRMQDFTPREKRP